MKKCKYCGNDIPKINVYCNNSCQGKFQSQEKYKYFLTEPDEFQTAEFCNRFLKPIILEEQSTKCSICQADNTHNNKKLVFILDHIDGNAANNTRGNLRLICPNCDSQLDTYKSKNRNSARTTRYKTK